MDVSGYLVAPLTSDRFDDFVEVLGTSGIGGCWCMYWLAPTSAAWGEGTRGGRAARNRSLFRDIVNAGPPPGLLADDDDHPVAWCRLLPRERLPGLARSRHYRTDLDIAGVWSLSCFVVRRAHRGKGLTSVLTRAAVSHVEQHGGHAVEVYPWETGERKADSIVYTGLASTFHRLGFEVVQRRVPHRPMMRRFLTDSAG